MPARQLDPLRCLNWTKHRIICLVLVAQFIASKLVVLGARQEDAHRHGFADVANLFFAVVELDVPELQCVGVPFAFDLQVLAAAQKEEISQQDAAPQELMSWIFHVEHAKQMAQHASCDWLFLQDWI